jgi:hypothetical protein
VTRCKQCASEMPDTGWTVCISCQKKNAEYQSKTTQQARTMRNEFCRLYGDTLRNERSPISGKEMRGRKARNAVVASHQPEDRDDC